MNALIKVRAQRVAIVSAILIMLFSCNDELVDNSFDYRDTLKMAISNNEIVLDELLFNNTVDLSWSTGTNENTGAAIKYTLQLDLASGDFTQPIATFLSEIQNKYTFSTSYGNLNQMLLDHGMIPDESYDLTARIVANVTHESVTTQVATTNLTVTTFKPVSPNLYIVGDASPNGWNIGSATQLVASTERRGVFVYEGPLNPGDYKFAVSQDGCWCQDFYTKDGTDGTKIIYNEGGSGDDLQWNIETKDNYRLTVDLLNKTIKEETYTSVNPDEPPFPMLWIVGDASESGWNIDSPVAFVQNENNLIEFIYEGTFSPGNFKILAGPLGDWCGEWYRPTTDNQELINDTIEQNAGCDTDNKWLITEATKGRYKIILNTIENSITFKKVSLYIIGDGGPNGWNINNPSPLVYENGEYVFIGELGADNATGEFKISKFIGNWCDGDWINSSVPNQSIFNSSFINTVGCDGPDNKWKLQVGQAGTYEIRINLDSNIMTITSQ
ncbi:SusF/SusE family outer membrane protein [Arenibacter sp. F26102]|uniref:SusF/SusE family outer membrane protein n=1 Tax=Arenibacter sp. F26102 TaxID=2926416 RepID=UPI001FF29C9E|nr:SusF/SusE family outer membrane protein [Arenibacter sp. F26102]MCK0145328.1 SusF/SusE family outer membrane protein [Arenibacter sp. F26102]